MKQTQFFLTTALAALSLIALIVLFGFGQANQKAQMALQKRQAEIQFELQQRQAQVNAGQQTSQLLQATVNVMQEKAKTNPKIKQVLIDNELSPQAPTQAPAPGAAPAPESKATPKPSASSSAPAPSTSTTPPSPSTTSPTTPNR
jgi:type II secretory pathway pseudopilin PulG